jgi:hypothetical protein
MPLSSIAAFDINYNLHSEISVIHSQKKQGFLLFLSENKASLKTTISGVYSTPLWIVLLIRSDDFDAIDDDAEVGSTSEI